MKNSKFNPLFESIYSRFKDGSGFLAGDVVKFKSDYKNLECYKKLAENLRQRIDDMIKTGNNIRVGRLHNQDSAYGALGGSSFPACHADLYEEVAPSFWRNLVTVPVECLETSNPALDLPPVPDNQKDKPRAYVKPVEASNDKPNKGAEIDEQTKVGKKQTHADKGNYELATKNKKLEHSNKYNDQEPSKVKGLKKAKELKESVENVYEKMLTESNGDYPLGTSDNPITGSPGNPNYNYRKHPLKSYTNIPDPEHVTISPELKQKIVNIWKTSKKTSAEIAQELNVKPYTVYKVLTSTGMLPEDAEGPQTWTDEDIGAMGSASNAE